MLFIFFIQKLKNLNILDAKLKELTERIQNLLHKQDNKNGADILEKLINLQSNIIKKKNAIEEKSLKLKSKFFNLNF